MNKYNLDPKFIKCAGCSKPAHPRQSIIPFKGQNGEELCHKCAPCAKCGNACRSYENGFYRHEKTNDNPSGE